MEVEGLAMKWHIRVASKKYDSRSEFSRAVREELSISLHVNYSRF